MSTIAAAPSVDALPAPDKGQQKASQEALSAELANPDVRNNIRDELKRMGENVVGMETDFATVSAFLTHLDNTGALLNKDGRVLKLFPEWKVMHDQYTALMNRSQETAVKLNVQIADLLEVFLPYIESKKISGPKKEKKLGQYIEELGVFVKDGTEYGNNFLRLREGVTAFKKKLHEEITNQLADVKSKIADLDKKITKIEEELKAIGDFLNKSWYKVGSTSGISGLINLAPESCVGLISKVFSCFGSNTMQETINKTKEKAAKEKQLLEFKKEKDALNERRGNLEEALKALNVLDRTFASLIGRLAAMEGIWRMLVADATGLKEKLNKINKEAEKPKTEDYDEEDAAFFLSLQLDGVKTVYSTLRMALDSYALSVAPSN